MLRMLDAGPHASSRVLASPCASAKATNGSSVPHRSSSRNQKPTQGRPLVARQVSSVGVSSAPAFSTPGLRHRRTDRDPKLELDILGDESLPCAQSLGVRCNGIW